MEPREELKKAFYEAIRPIVKNTCVRYAAARLPSQDCIEDLIVSLGNATAADEMVKGDFDVHQNV